MQKIIKRAFDITFAALGLVMLFPVFLIVGIIIKRGSPGPVLFKQERVGMDSVSFTMYKFRTMYIDIPEDSPLVTSAGDPRVTPNGALLRRYKLDELPQLINVLKGDMSFVGPRPEMAKHIQAYPEEYERVLTVRPGITDYAAIEYKNEEEILQGYEDPQKAYIEEVLPKKIALYDKYIEEQSLLTDLKIILRTVLTLAGKEHAHA